jgi:ribosomal protein L34
MSNATSELAESFVAVSPEGRVVMIYVEHYQPDAKDNPSELHGVETPRFRLRTADGRIVHRRAKGRYESTDMPILISDDPLAP